MFSREEYYPRVILLSTNFVNFLKFIINIVLKYLMQKNGSTLFETFFSNSF